MSYAMTVNILVRIEVLEGQLFDTMAYELIKRIKRETYWLYKYDSLKEKENDRKRIQPFKYFKIKYL